MQQQTPQPNQTKKRWKSDEHNMRRSNVASGGLLAISVIVLQAFIPLGLHNISSYIVTISLTIAMPCLVATILTNTYEVDYPYKSSGKVMNTIFLVGIFSGLVSLAATFWYISWIVGITFIIVLLTIAVFAAYYTNQLSQDEDGQHKFPRT